ncbi:MAG: MATE family efflux transporter, partial [Clostridia bacterium]
MVKDKEFYKRFFSMCVVIVLQNIITLSVNLADNVMLGNYNETALSGATAVNQLQFVYQQLLLGIGDALVILGSQYWGRKQTGKIKTVASIAIACGITVMLIYVVLTTVMPREIVAIFTKDEAIIDQGVAYLITIKYTYIFFCFTSILLSLLRSVETVKIAFYLSISSLIINCSINYILIYGHFGFPEMGIEGAAIGTLISRIIELSLLVLYIIFKEKKLQINLKELLYFDKKMFFTYIKIAVPIIIGAAFWGINTAAQTAILGNMSSSAIAANSVASNLFLLVKTSAVGTASTTAVLIGKMIGQGKTEELKTYSRTFQVMFVIFGAVCSVILYFLIDPVLSIYNLSEESKNLAHSFLLVLVFIMFFMSYQMPTNTGLIRGAG